MNPFSTGRPGRMKHNRTSLLIAQDSSARLQTSLPLSTVKLSGKLPRSSFARSNACATFIPLIERSASNPTHSRGELIHHRQDAERTSIPHLIAHKIHPPTLICSRPTPLNIAPPRPTSLPSFLPTSLPS